MLAAVRWLVLVSLAACGASGDLCALDTDCAFGDICVAERCTPLGGPDDPECIRGPGGVCLNVPEAGVDAGPDVDASVPARDAAPGRDAAPTRPDGALGVDTGPAEILDAGPPFDGGPPPAPGVRREGEVVLESVRTVTRYDEDDPRLPMFQDRHRLEARFYETSDDDPCFVAMRLGDCALYVCTMDSVSETPFSAGTVTASALADVSTTPPYAPVTGETQLVAEAGGDVAFSAGGEAVPAFGVGVEAPSQVLLTMPAIAGGTVTLDAGSTQRVAWTGGTTGTLVFHVDYMSGPLRGFLECRFDAASGSGDIPLRDLSGTLPPGIDASGYIHVERERRVALPSFWNVTTRVEIPGTYETDDFGSTADTASLSVRLR